MEDVFGREKQACPCSKECQEFQKLLELKKSGLVVYLHRPRADDGCTPSVIRHGEAVGSEVNPSEDVFIIYNKKNVTITTSELTSEFEKKKIICPRCRKTFEHAQELMQDVKSIDRTIVMGICDHCRKKSQTTEKPFCDCDQIVKKFMYVNGEQKEDTKKHAKKIFSPEIEFLRTGATLKKQKKTRTYSDLQINLGLSSPSRHDPDVQPKFYSPADLKSDTAEISETDSREFYRKQINLGLSSPCRHDPDVQPMFYSHTDLKSDKTEISETDSREFYRKQAVTFIQPIKSHEGVHAKIPAPSLLESDTSLMDTYKEVKEFPRPSLKDHKREEIFEDIPSLDAKEALKRRHDLSLRQMMRLDKDTDGPDSVSKRPEVYETPKISPWEQMETISKYHVGSKTDLKKIPPPTKKKSKQDRSARDLDDPRLDKDTDGPHSVSKRREVYETRKISPWEQMETISKYHVGSKTDINKIPPPTKTKSKQDRSARDLDDPNRQSQFRSLRTAQRNIQGSYLEPSKFDKNHHDKILKKDEELKIQRNDETSDNKQHVGKISRKMKKTHVSKSESLGTVGVALKPYFSFSFPKVKEKKSKKSVAGVNSSNVIKDAQEKYILKAEREQEQALKKNLAREEKKLQAKEKKRQTLEDKKDQALQDKKKYAEEQITLTEKDKSKEHKSEIDGEPAVAKKDEKSISKPQSKTKQGIEEIPKPEEKGDDGKAKSDAEHAELRTKQKEKTKIEFQGLEKGRDKLDIEALIKQTSKERELMKKEKQENDDATSKKEKHATSKKEKFATSKKEKQEKDATSKKEKQEKDAISKNEKQEKDATSKKEEQEIDANSMKAKRTKKTGRDSSDETDLSTPKTQKSLSEEIKEFSGKKKVSNRKSAVQGPPKITEAELKKLKAEHLRAKEENQKKEDLRKAQKGELKISKIKIKKRNSNEILKSIRLKQTKSKTNPSDVHPDVIKQHRCHQQSGQQSLLCPLCVDSELELDLLSLEMEKSPPIQKTDIIIGENILKCRPRLEKTKILEGVPIFFQKDFVAEPDYRTEEEVQIIPEETKHVQNKQILGTVEVESGKGIIRYALSDRTFIDKGWTMLPTEKVVRKMNVYRMRPAHPEFNWFEHNKNKGLMTYDTGERLAEFDNNGRCRWYYRSGQLALDYYDAEETNTQQRFVIYSSGEPDERGRTRPITILATFDYLGNGIVFDHAGKIRLKYNQTEGVVLDRAIGPATHWQWHSLNDPPVLQQVMIDTQISHKDPEILKLGPQSDPKIRKENEDMLAIEFDNFIRDKAKKLSQKFKPFQIKMKAMKINEHFSLKILDQATVYLIYRDGTTNMKLNIGMLLDHKEIVDTDTAELGEVSNSLERFPARSDSLAILQDGVAYAQRHERQRTNRERILLRPQGPCASADILTAAASPPMRLPLVTVPTGSSSSTGHCSRTPVDNFYYL